MQRSEGHIRTSHAGRLPRLVAESETLPRQVTAVVKKQVEIGIDCVGDGEFWNGRNFQYYTQQLGGVTERPLTRARRRRRSPPRPCRPGCA